MATAANPRVVISGEDRTKAAFTSAKRSIGELAKGTDALGLSLGKLGRLAGAAGGLGGLAALGGAASIGGMVAFAKSVSATGDELAKLSQRTGVSVETLGELKHVADLNDSSLEGLATGFRELSKRMADAATGGKESTAAFRAIGVEVKNADGSLRNVDEILLEVSDRFASYEDGAAKSALATKLFGESGTDLIPLLNQGSRAIAQQREEARRYGVVSTELAKKSEEFNDNLTRIGRAAEGAALKIGGPLVESLADVSTRFLKATESGEGFWASLKRAVSEDPVKVLRREIAGLKNDIASLEAGQGPADAGARAALLGRKRADLAAASVRLEAEQFSRSPAGGGRGFGAPPQRQAAPTLEGDDKAKTQRLSDADRYLESLKLQLQATQDLSIADKLLADIQAGRLGKVSKAQEADLLGIALQIDAARDLATFREADQKAREQAAALSERSIAALVSETDAMASANRSIAEEIELIGKNAKELAVLEQARLADAIAAKEQALAQAQVAGASPAEIQALQQQIALLKQRSELLGRRGATQQLANDAQRVKDFADQVGASFKSAFEDAIVGGEKLSDVLKGVAKDLLRLVIRNQIAGPAAQAIGSYDWGSLFGGFRAAGGSVRRGMFYEVNERGPELLTVNGRQYLMMGNQSGNVTPAGAATQAAAPVVNIYNNSSAQARTEQRSEGGAPVLDVYIEEVAARSISAGGRVAKAAESTYGLNRGAGAPRRTR